MTQQPAPFTPPPADDCHVRSFTGKRAETPEALAALTPESQAGLRQYSLERMTGYGVDYADAIEFRARVLQGEPWLQAACAMADDVAVLAQGGAPPASDASRITLHERASALLRLSQALMLQDTPQRVDIVERALDHFERATALRGDRRHVRIETPYGPMGGWFHPARGMALGSAVCVGGIEGWAMDFDCIGDALARRGVNALLLDGPGQGETRILHRHYLTPEWREAWRCAIDFVERELPGQPIGVVGNSMGGSLAMAMANDDRRVVACCDNGGILKPSQGRAAGATFFAKMVAFCGTAIDEDRAAAVWDTVEPVTPAANRDYTLLVVQGGLDPLVSVEHGKLLLEKAPARHKRMELFSDGDHCIYNRRSDRDVLIADWLREQLAAASPAR